MPKYLMTGISIPIQAEAYQLTPETLGFITPWCNGQQVDQLVEVEVPTPVGVKTATENDWIVKTHLGTFHVYDPETFARSYKEI